MGGEQLYDLNLLGNEQNEEENKIFYITSEKNTIDKVLMNKEIIQLNRRFLIDSFLSHKWVDCDKEIYKLI